MNKSAIPVAAYFMRQWLQDFASKITISWWLFFLAGTTALLLTIVTISFQSIRAALSNPVDTLRSEY